MDIISKVKNNKNNRNVNVLVVILLFIILIVPTALGCCSFFTYKSVNISDLNEIEGTIKEVQFETIGKNKGALISLKEYSSDFCVWSVDLRAFNSEKFKKDNKKGDKIKLLISKNDLNKLSYKGNRKIFGVASYNQVYMDIKDLNYEEKVKAIINLLVGLLVSTLSIILLVFYVKESINKTGKEKFNKNHVVVYYKGKRKVVKRCS